MVMVTMASIYTDGWQHKGAGSLLTEALEIQIPLLDVSIPQFSRQWRTDQLHGCLRKDAVAPRKGTSGLARNAMA